MSRFVQGAASVLCWSAGMSWIVEIDGSRRRGQAISTVTGAGAAGAVVGPLAGALAGAVGLTLAFSCLAALVVPLIEVAGATPAGDVQAGASRHYVFHEKRRSRHKILIALWLVALPSISLAALSVVGPLQLHQTGWGAGGIAASYLTAAVVGVVGRPIVGRYSDRRGRLAPIFMILLVCLPVMLLIAWIRARFMLAGLFATAVLFYGELWGPSMALLADEWEEIGGTQVLGFALMYLITAPVGVIGSFGGGALAAGAGDRTVLLCIAALSLGSVFVIRRLLRRQINEPRQSVLA